MFLDLMRIASGVVFGILCLALSIVSFKAAMREAKGDMVVGLLISGAWLSGAIGCFGMALGIEALSWLVPGGNECGSGPWRYDC